MRSFILLILVLAIAYFTLPTSEKFNSYLEKKGRNGGVCPLGKRHESYKIFTIDHVDYCDTSHSNTPRPLLSKPLKTDRYIGIFGTFFKV